MLRLFIAPPSHPDAAGCATRRFHVAWGATLLVATGLAYWPALHGTLLWDDAAHVTAPALRSLHGLFRIWFELGATQQYYPTLHTVFWLEHRWWGDAVFGYHAANLFFHGAACLLFWAVLRRLRVPGALLAAFVFALHPVAVESVAWISEQKNTLSLVFYLAAALAYLEFDAHRRPLHYALGLLSFFLALSTKSVTATLPAALLVITWWRRGQLEWRSDVRPLLPWLFAGAFAGGFTAWVERSIVGAHGADYALSSLARLLLAGRALCFYFGKLVWPASLSFIYPRWTVDPAAAGQYLFLAGGVTALALAFAFRRHHRGPLAVGLLFAGTLFPALGFFNVYSFAYSYVADHFQYHAMLAIIAAAGAGWACWDSFERGLAPSWRRHLPRLAALAVVGGLAVETWSQCHVYADAETLYRVTLAQNPSCALAHNNLGVILARQGRTAAAITQYEQALAAKPDDPEAENNLGGELSRIPGREPEAVLHFEAALRIRPDFTVAEDNLANVLALTPGRWAEAERHFRRVLALEPDFAKAHNDFAIALARIPSRATEALAQYQAALAIEPDQAGLHANYAYELSRMPGRLNDAEAEYAAALRLAPEDADVHDNLANLLATLPGRETDAIAHYQTALRLRPDFAEAHNNLANELIQIPGRAAEAVTHYEAAVRIKPDYAEAHNNLAIAYANLGRIDEAARHFRRAIEIRPDFQAARDNLARLLSAP